MAKTITKKITTITEDFTTDPITKVVSCSVHIDDGNGYVKKARVMVKDADLTKSINTIIKTKLDQVKEDEGIS